MYEERIANVPLLAALPAKLRKVLAKIVVEIGKVRVLKKNERLYAEGALDDNTGAILVDGGLMITYNRQTTLFIQAPEVFGEMQQFNERHTRTAEVRAPLAATVIEFAWPDLFARIQDCADIPQADQLLLRNAFTKFADDRLKRR